MMIIVENICLEVLESEMLDFGPSLEGRIVTYRLCSRSSRFKSPFEDYFLSDPLWGCTFAYSALNSSLARWVDRLCAVSTFTYPA